MKLAIVPSEGDCVILRHVEEGDTATERDVIALGGIVVDVPALPATRELLATSARFDRAAEGGNITPDGHVRH